MNTHADQTQENKSQAVSAVDSQMQSGGESTFQFVDNRPEAIAQRKLQEMVNNSPQVSQLRNFQDMANNSPQAKQAAQLQAMADKYSAKQMQPIQKKENNTGLPGNLKTGIENLSGMSLDDVKVHRNSDKPAQLQAHAYAQGTDIHLGPGQERHLPHEAWHVVQQKQGRVKPTMQMKGAVNVNDDVGLEKEADIMGAKAATSTLKNLSIESSKLQNDSNKHDQRLSIQPKINLNNQPNGGIAAQFKSEAIQLMKGLTAEDQIYVHTTLGPMAAVVIATLDGGEAYRVKLTGHHNQVYEVSHFIVDTSADRLPSDTTLAKEIEYDAEHEDSIKTKIVTELNRLIATKAEKMAVIERMSRLEDGAEVSPEDQAALRTHEGEASSQVTALMLEVEARQRGGGFDPFIVDDTSFGMFIQDLQIAIRDEVQGISTLKKLHMVFLGDGHYTPVIIQIGTNAHLQVFSVDASGTPKNFSKFQALADKNFSDLEKDIHFYSDGDVQMDGFHCETFSIDDLKTMTNMSTEELIAGIPEMHLPDMPDVEGEEPDYHQDIDTIDPRFMYNAQSNTKIHTYKEGRDTEDSELAGMDVHIEQNSVLSRTGAKENRSIDYSRYQKLITVRNLLEQSSLQEVENILDKRIYGYRDIISG
jgi:hypothetical protein